MMKVSILVPAHNEELSLLNMLASLEQQSFVKNIEEVLIADNASTDGTFETISRFAHASSLQIKSWRRIENNLGAARRELVNEAKSDWLVFIDADCVAPKDWLKKLIELAEAKESDPRFAGLSGGHSLPNKNLTQQAISDLLVSTPFHGFSAQSQPGTQQGRRVDHLPTTNAIFRKSALIDVGNFSKTFSTVGEDLDLGLRVTGFHYKLYSFSEPTLINDCASTYSQWLKRMFRFGTAQGLVFGRRKGFITSALCLGLLIMVAGVFSPMLWLFAMATSSLTMALMSLWTTLNTKSSFARSFLVSQTTPYFYFAGFLFGIGQRIFPLSH